MKILSLNLNKKEFDYKNDEKVEADIYSFQESKLLLPKGTRINTVNIVENLATKGKLTKFKDIWQSFFPWREFPENYFAENEIQKGDIEFTLINVHLAGFRSEIRNLIMFTLLKRLDENDLKNKNVILIGDFNAEIVEGKSTIGAKYLQQIINKGFIELISEKEVEEKCLIKTYVYKNNSYRYDHAYIKYKDKHTSYHIDVSYFPDDNEKWESDHRGIILEIDLIK